MKMPLRLAWLLAGLWLFALPVTAHTLSVSHLDIVVPSQGGDDRIELDLALKDLALTLPLDANREPRSPGTQRLKRAEIVCGNPQRRSA